MLALTVGDPSTTVPGLTPRSPVIVVVPVFVTVSAARTPKDADDPKTTADGPTLAPSRTPRGRLLSQHPATATASTDATTHETLLLIRIMNPPDCRSVMCLEARHSRHHGAESAPCIGGGPAPQPPPENSAVHGGPATKMP